MRHCLNESQAREQIYFIKNIFDALVTNPNILSKEDWWNWWRSTIEDACKFTEDADLKKVGVKVISGFDEFFNHQPC